jgi:hypothetical protein
MMKFSGAISWVKWLSGEQTNVSKTISVLVLRVLVCRPRELYHTLRFAYQCDRHTGRTYGRLFTAMFPSMAEMLECEGEYFEVNT